MARGLASQARNLTLAVRSPYQTLENEMPCPALRCTSEQTPPPPITVSSFLLSHTYSHRHIISSFSPHPPYHLFPSSSSAPSPRFAFWPCLDLLSNPPLVAESSLQSSHPSSLRQPSPQITSRASSTRTATFFTNRPVHEFIFHYIALSSNRPTTVSSNHLPELRTDR